jgi:hypothetical protein
MAGFRSQAGDISLLHRVQASSGVHPTSYPVGTESSISSGKAVRGGGVEAYHLPPSNTEIKNGGAIPPLPYTSSWRGA